MYQIRSLENEFYTRSFCALRERILYISCPQRSFCLFNHSRSLLSILLLKKRKLEFSAERLNKHVYNNIVYIFN